MRSAVIYVCEVCESTLVTPPEKVCALCADIEHRDKEEAMSDITHVLVIESDADYIARFGDHGDDPALTYELVCSAPARCPAWMECMEPHSEPQLDDDDGEPVVMHGIEHTWRPGWGWTVDYPHCPVKSAFADGDTHIDIARTHGVGRHPVDVKWVLGGEDVLLTAKNPPS